MKIVAVLIGPSGVGVVNILQSATQLISTFTQLGIDSSAVREIANATASNEHQRLTRAVITLRRLVWITGSLGMLLTVVLSYPLSCWLFQTSEMTVSIACLSTSVLLGALSGGQLALLQGTRRIRLVAALGIFSAAAATVIAGILYYFYREDGIVAVLVSTSCITLAVNWYGTSKVKLEVADVTYEDTLKAAWPFVSLGLSFMWSGLIASAVALIIRSEISRTHGLEAVGIFAAAWSLSGMLANFVLQAMSADFYPRLTGVADDNTRVNRMVNEQIEIACLIGVPGLLLTLAVSPWIVSLVYTPSFSKASELMPYFVGSVFIQVSGYPLGFIQRAKAKSGWIFLSQTEANLLLLGLTLVLIRTNGLVGCAIASLSMYTIHQFVTLGIARHLSGFRFEPSTVVVLLTSLALMLPAIAFSIFDKSLTASLLVLLFSLVSTIVAFAIIVSRLPIDHKFRCRLFRKHS